MVKNEELKKEIENVIIKNAESKSIYREPIFAYSKTNNNKFNKILTTIPDHLMPNDLLKDAKTVCAFFLPFSEQIIYENREEEPFAKSWAMAYVSTNNLINYINSQIKEYLNNSGFDSNFVVPTGSGKVRESYFNKDYYPDYSHRHVAWVCGLGEFGMNNMLITKTGCAGRYGSFVTDAEFEFETPDNVQRCYYKINKSCGKCFSLCPVKALKPEGFEAIRCYDRLMENGKLNMELEYSRVCGKCAVGPCAIFKE